MKKFFFFLATCVLTTAPLFLRAGDPDTLFGLRPEIYFRCTAGSLKQVQQLASIVSVDDVRGMEVYAYANRKEFDRFLEMGLPFTKLPCPSENHVPQMRGKTDLKAVDDWDFYPTYEAYLDIMNQFETNYPAICEVYSIGTSIQGREIMVAHIGDNLAVTEDEPQFFYTSTMHGDEVTGYVLMLHLIDHLLTNYGSDPRITGLVNNIDIWINPLANPDGTYHGGNGSVYGATRYNAAGVDINRNFPDPEDGPHPDGNPWQAETIVFMDFAESHHFVSSANLHGGAEVCNYPWDTWAQLHPDDDWWQYVCREYADTVHEYAPTGYLNDLNNGITNGYQWYEVAGGRQDYNTYFHQGREFTLEISENKMPQASQMPAFWEYNYRSFLNYMEQSTFGIRGKVTDAANGNPVEAEIFIESHDHDSSMVFSHLPLGAYYRPVFEGTYTVKVSAWGYYPQTFTGVTVTNRNITTLDVQLTPGTFIPDFVASQTVIGAGQDVDFTDLTYGNPVSWSWTFEGGNPATSAVQNPSGIVYANPGSFDVSLTVSDGTNTQTVTKQDYIHVSVEYLMQNTTVSTCTGTFYDSGGASQDYDDNEDFTMTFLPVQTGDKVRITFSSFNVEWESSCDYDWLKIYDGPTASSPLIGTYCGTDSPGEVTATNAQGALTFRFHSDYSQTEAGWSAAVECLTTLPPVAEFGADHTTIIQQQSVSFTDLSQNNPTSWQWTFEGGIPSSSSVQNPVIAYQTPGTYDVTLTVTNAFGSDTETKTDYIVVNPLVGIGEQDMRVTLYPNPVTDGKVHLSLSSPVERIEVYDPSGRIVLSFSPHAGETAFDLEFPASGIFFLKVSGDRGVIQSKIMVMGKR